MIDIAAKQKDIGLMLADNVDYLLKHGLVFLGAVVVVEQVA